METVPWSFSIASLGQPQAKAGLAASARPTTKVIANPIHPSIMGKRLSPPQSWVKPPRVDQEANAPSGPGYPRGRSYGW